MKAATIAHLRLARQRLTGAPLAGAAQVVQWLGAVQAQDYAGAKWALAQRCDAPLLDSDIDQLFARGLILRTHVLRPTWHFVAPADIRWLLALTAPRVHDANAYYYRKLELSGALLRRGGEVLARALEGGKQLTRTELAQALARARIEASGLRLAYLIMAAELEATLCSGGLRGKQFTYALLEERVPPTPPLAREQALAELTRRYFRSRGPATLHDFANWSGLTLADVKLGVELAAKELERSSGEAGVHYWDAPAPAKAEGARVHLLPNYDEYISGYKDRGAYFSPALAGAPQLTQTLAAHILVCDGKIIGGWRRRSEKQRTTAEVALLTPLAAAAQRALQAAAKRYGAFLGQPVELALNAVGAAST